MDQPQQLPKIEENITEVAESMPGEVEQVLQPSKEQQLPPVEGAGENRNDTLAMEQPAQSPALPIITDDDQTVAPVANVDDQTTDDAIAEDVSTKIAKSEKPWLKEAKDIIKEYEDEPYQEEEASEALNKKYLNKRFGVTVDEEQGK